jgi:hypothetical protein
MLCSAWQKLEWPKHVLKTCCRSKPFQQDQLYEDRSLGTGVKRRKTANNIDDSIYRPPVKDIKGLLKNINIEITV